MGSVVPFQMRRPRRLPRGSLPPLRPAEAQIVILQVVQRLPALANEPAAQLPAPRPPS